MRSHSIFFRLLLISILLGIGSSSMAVETKKTERQVSVQGTGHVHATPDIARLTVEVSEEGPRVEDITQKVRSKIDAVIKAVRAKGVADKDIQTQSYRVSPLWRWDNGKQTRIGYSAANQIRITVRDLKNAGPLLTAALDAGANTVNGPDFDFDNPEALQHKALEQAMLEARTKAVLLAKTAGAELGEVVQISESGATPFPGPRPYFAAARMAKGLAAATESAPEPIASGEETVTATVSATFALH